MDLSVVIPCYEEQECLPLLFDRLESTFADANLTWQLVLINDGSKDATWDLIQQTITSGRFANAVAVDFSRNFGKEAAFLAGLTHATGEVVGLMDADLQQPPETLLDMYRTLMKNPVIDCVAAFQKVRHEGRIRGWVKHCFYTTFNAITDDGVELVPDASDFRVFRRSVADALLAMPEYYRFSKGLFSWVGFRTLPYPYEPDPRVGGTSKWSLQGLIAYAAEGIFAFSTVPLRLATWAGMASALAAVIYLCVVVYEALALQITPSGYATIVCLTLFMGGLTLLTLGIIGKYVARIYVEGKRRPVYLARQVTKVLDGQVTDHGFERGGSLH